MVEASSLSRDRSIYPLRAHLVHGDEYVGDPTRHNHTGKVRKTLERIQHRLDLQILEEQVPDDEKRQAIYRDPSMHVYRRGVLRRGQGRLDNSVVTGTGDAFRKRTSSFRPWDLPAFVRGATGTWVAIRFAKGQTASNKIDLPKKI